jgi:hypothetical protein
MAETHINRQATQRSFLPSLLGVGDKRIEIVYADGKKYFLLGRLEQPRQKKISCTGTTSPNYQTKEEPLSFVLFESPFTSVSTVSRGHPSLVSLVTGLKLKVRRSDPPRCLRSYGGRRTVFGQ